MVKRGRGGVGAREWGAQGGEWGPKGWGPKHRKSVGSRRVGAQRVGTQTQKRWGARRVGGTKGGDPNPEKVGARRMGGTKGGGHEGWGPEGWGPERWGAQHFAPFFPSPAHIFFFFFSLWGSSRGILVVFWSVGTSNVLVFRLSCGSPRRPAGRRGFTGQPEGENKHHLNMH